VSNELPKNSVGKEKSTLYSPQIFRWRLVILTAMETSYQANTNKKYLKINHKLFATDDKNTLPKI
jgi:hypothetical protein